MLFPICSYTGRTKKEKKILWDEFRNNIDINNSNETIEMIDTASIYIDANSIFQLSFVSIISLCSVMT